MMKLSLSAVVLAQAHRAWKKIFCSTDPFGWPFTDQAKAGRVLYPTDGCMLSRGQFEALYAASSKGGDSYCFVVVVEGEDGRQGFSAEGIFKINLADYGSYESLHLTLENAIYSVEGAWGVLVSHEMHAILGGSAAFIAEFNNIDHLAREQWNKFKSDWSEQKDKAWVDSISSHV